MHLNFQKVCNFLLQFRLNLILAENGQKNYKFNINFRFVTIEEFTWLFLEQIYSRQEQSEVKKALTVIISEKSSVKSLRYEINP